MRPALTAWLLAALLGGSAAAAPLTAERKATGTAVSSPARLTPLPSSHAPRPQPKRRPEPSPPHPATTPGRPAAPASGAPKPAPAATRASIEGRIATAREIYQAGRYAEVPALLFKLLSETQLTPLQLTGVYELLASAYVALGQTELAIRCFTEVLNRRPAFALDPVRTSPKIRAALDQAKLQPPSAGPAASPAGAQSPGLSPGSAKPTPAAPALRRPM